jgi:hypothetical protein
MVNKVIKNRQNAVEAARSLEMLISMSSFIDHISKYRHNAVEAASPKIIEKRTSQ